MTTPATTQTSLKSWVALIGSLITGLVPILTIVQGWLPPQYAAIAALVLSILTRISVYFTSNARKGTVLVAQPISLPPPTKGPWK